VVAAHPPALVMKVMVATGSQKKVLLRAHATEAEAGAATLDADDNPVANDGLTTGPDLVTTDTHPLDRGTPMLSLPWETIVGPMLLTRLPTPANGRSWIE
jgi:hypothetical protein